LFQFNDWNDGIDAVVISGVNSFYEEVVDLENADDKSFIHKSLVQADAVIPEVVGLLVKRQTIKIFYSHFVKLNS
jgi:hypothetical protein